MRFDRGTRLLLYGGERMKLLLLGNIIIIIGDKIIRLVDLLSHFLALCSSSRLSSGISLLPLGLFSSYGLF
jgi:hypothetical protein